MNFIKCFPLIFVVLMGACSSNSKSNNSSASNEFEEDIEKEFEGIGNEDFKKPPQVKYEENTDYYNIAEDSEEKSSSIVDESIDSLKANTSSVKPLISSPISQGLENCYDKNLDEGISNLNNQARNNQKNPAFFLALGNCYFLKGKTRLALLYYNKSRSLNLNYAPALNNIGVIQELKGLHQSALSAYESALKAQPLASVPAFNISQLYLKYHLPKLALPMLGKLVKTDSSNVEIMIALANANLMLGKFDEAISYFEKANSTHKIPSSHALLFAYALALNNQKEKAAEIINDIGSFSGQYDVGLYQAIRREFSL